MFTKNKMCVGCGHIVAMKRIVKHTEFYDLNLKVDSWYCEPCYKDMFNMIRCDCGKGWVSKK